MPPTLISGSAHVPLAEAIARELDVTLCPRTLERFPDGELHVEIESSLRGHDVYIVQPTSPPVEAHIFELLLLADACRRAGAARLTAVVPYFGYARQDRRSRGREPVSVRVVADLLQTAGFSRLVALDLHSRASEAIFAMPLEQLTAVPLLASTVAPWARDDVVVVAPDLGAVKLAQRYARLLGASVAIAHKQRVSPEGVRVVDIVGTVRDRQPLIVDDMVTTGGTIEAAARAVLEQGAVPKLVVAVTHSLLVGPAADRLAALPLSHVIVSNSVLQPPAPQLPRIVADVGPLLAEAIGRLHRDRTLADLVKHE
jgi:ribose-phosphate pyrophosphokinase